MIRQYLSTSFQIARKYSRLLVTFGIIVILVMGITVLGVRSPLVYLAALAAPAGIFLLLNIRWALWMFIASLPLEMILPGDVLTIPKILGVLVLVSWGLSIIRAHQKIRFDTSLIYFSLFIIWGILSLIWTINSGDTLQKILTYIQLFALYLIIINVVRNREDFNQILLALWIGGLIFIGSGALDLITGSFTQRIEGVSGNSNLYAVWCTTLLPIFIIVAKKGGIFKLINIIGMLVLLITVVYTQSRGGIISFGVFALTWLIFQPSRFRSLLIILFAALVIWQVAPAELWGRFAVIGNDSIDRFRDLWPAGWTIFTDHLILGVGLGTNGTALDLSGLFFLGRNIGSVHNAPLAIAMEVGIPGLALYLGFIMRPTLSLLATINQLRILKHKELFGMAVFIMAALAAFYASWIKTGGFEYSKILWLLLGLATCLINFTKGSNSVSLITTSKI